VFDAQVSPQILRFQVNSIKLEFVRKLPLALFSGLAGRGPPSHPSDSLPVETRASESSLGFSGVPRRKAGFKLKLLYGGRAYCSEFCVQGEEEEKEEDGSFHREEEEEEDEAKDETDETVHLFSFHFCIAATLCVSREGVHVGGETD
jgi:hypothetical protein